MTIESIKAALEWQSGESRSSLGDLYAVLQLSEHVCTTYKNGTAFPGWKPTLDEAKAAAQADYDARLSALSHPVEQDTPAPQPHLRVPSDLIDLREENAKLRSVLEWYADEVMAYSITQANEPRSAVHGDRGARARAALATSAPEVSE